MKIKSLFFPIIGLLFCANVSSAAETKDHPVIKPIPDSTLEDIFLKLTGTSDIQAIVEALGK